MESNNQIKGVNCYEFIIQHRYSHPILQFESPIIASGGTNSAGREAPLVYAISTINKACHCGTLEVGCLTVCDLCRYRITENWQVYERLKILANQKLS